MRAGDGEQRAEHGAVAIEPSRDPEEPPKPVAYLSRRHLARPVCRGLGWAFTREMQQPAKSWDDPSHEAAVMGRKL